MPRACRPKRRKTRLQKSWLALLSKQCSGMLRRTQALLNILPHVARSIPRAAWYTQRKEQPLPRQVFAPSLGVCAQNALDGAVVLKAFARARHPVACSAKLACFHSAFFGWQALPLSLAHRYPFLPQHPLSNVACSTLLLGCCAHFCSRRFACA